ncbi:MAG: amino acid racemase [Clostridiales Family XIII bacterium]|nr:amino acid racemase [Clostridiales Family XIII bacterium]
MAGDETKKIGVIGGMGPAATLLFYQMVIEHTAACNDQQHIDMILLNHASMPDRTRALREGRRQELLEKLIEDARTLESCGADGIVITCNTSYTLADEIQAGIGVPLLHMIREAARESASRFDGQSAKIAILATDGTVESGIYQREVEKTGLTSYVPSVKNQRLVMKLIYDGVKSGGVIDFADFTGIERELEEAGCDGAILACTELSVFKERFELPEFYLDAMLSLAKKTIAFAGKEYR